MLIFIYSAFTSLFTLLAGDLLLVVLLVFFGLGDVTLEDRVDLLLGESEELEFEALVCLLVLPRGTASYNETQTSNYLQGDPILEFELLLSSGGEFTNEFSSTFQSSCMRTSLHPSSSFFCL